MRGNQKGRAREKRGKAENPKVLDAVEEHALLERQLSIKKKYVVKKVRQIANKHLLSTY